MIYRVSDLVDELYHITDKGKMIGMEFEGETFGVSSVFAYHIPKADASGPGIQFFYCLEPSLKNQRGKIATVYDLIKALGVIKYNPTIGGEFQGICAPILAVIDNQRFSSIYDVMIMVYDGNK